MKRASWPAAKISAAAKATVALVACPDYDDARVLAALRRGIDLLGGIARFSPGAQRRSCSSPTC